MLLHSGARNPPSQQLKCYVMPSTTPTGAYSLDDSDLRILAALQEDAALDNQELARKVHLSPAPCLRRVRRLTQDGIIRHTVALLDAARLGLGVEVFACGIEPPCMPRGNR